MIAKNLKISLGLKEQGGLMFFNGYGSDTAKKWNGFQAQTRDIVRTSQDFAAMLEGALITFSSLSNRMEAS